jgi:hypothetical protein
MSDLPKFWELAEDRLARLGPRDKVITFKVARRTARMMVEAEKAADQPAAKRRNLEQTRVEKFL